MDLTHKRHLVANSPAVNFLKILASSSWGSDPSIMTISSDPSLTMAPSCMNPSHTQLSKVDRLQNTALRLIIVSFKSTPTHLSSKAIFFGIRKKSEKRLTGFL